MLSVVVCMSCPGCMDEGMKLVLGKDFVLDGDPVPLPQKGRSPHPQYSAHLYCAETAGCIKMPLGMG